MDDSKILRFSLVQNEVTKEYFAFMLERMFYTLRWFYFMDETGQHNFVPETKMYQYTSLGKAACTDAKSILVLLRACNEVPGMVQDYLNAFRKGVGHE